jgi:hypothetical protein
VADGVREIDQPAFKSPLRCVGIQVIAEGEVGRSARLERRLDLVRKLFQGFESELDLLPGLLLDAAMTASTASSSSA